MEVVGNGNGSGAVSGPDAQQQSGQQQQQQQRGQQAQAQQAQQPQQIVVGAEDGAAVEHWQAALQELCRNAQGQGASAAAAAAAAAAGGGQATQAYFANPIGGTPAYGLWSTQPLLTAYGAIPFFSGMFPGGYTMPAGNSLSASGAAAGNLKDDDREESGGIATEGRISGRASKRAKMDAMQHDDLNPQELIAESPKSASPGSMTANGVKAVACNETDGAAAGKGGLTIDALAAAARAAALSSGTSSSDFWHVPDTGMDIKMPMVDEKEIKKQRRKQSNRESARRSRLRKQQECENLHRQVKELTEENQELKKQLQELKDLLGRHRKENKDSKA